MPFIREPIFHDRQDIIVEGPITTTSTEFEDIPGAQLITADLSQTGSYQVWLSLSVENSNNNTSITFRIIIGGISGQDRTVDFGPGAGGDPQHATLIGEADDVEADTLIEFQWKVSGGTGTINGLRILIDGIPGSRIIPAPSPGLDSYLTEAGDALLKEEGTFLLLETQPLRFQQR